MVILDANYVQNHLILIAGWGIQLTLIIADTLGTLFGVPNSDSHKSVTPGVIFSQTSIDWI